MTERPTIHVNLGQTVALIAAARATIYDACAKTDARIAAHQTPTEGNYLEQLGASMMALRLCDDAMRLTLRVLGGNGLREGQSFERRYSRFSGDAVAHQRASGSCLRTAWALRLGPADRESVLNLR